MSARLNCEVPVDFSLEMAWLSRYNPITMKTILVPIDLSATAATVIEAAIALAASTQGKMVLLHVVQPPIITSDYGIAMENLEELVAVSEKTANRQLASMKEKYSTPELPIETAQLVGAPIPLIIEEARRQGADYIVMGSHGHSAFYDLMVGTTTHGVLKNAQCPVLIVPPTARRR